MDESYIVYVCTDDVGHITAINSSAFLTDTEGWTAIDEGYSDKYHHAQGNYFPLPLFGPDGCATISAAFSASVRSTGAPSASL